LASHHFGPHGKFFTRQQTRADLDARSAQGAVMHDEQKDLAYYLGKAEDYRTKAKAVSEPGLKAALEAVAREYLAKARELDPTLSPNGGK